MSDFNMNSFRDPEKRVDILETRQNELVKHNDDNMKAINDMENNVSQNSKDIISGEANDAKWHGRVRELEGDMKGAKDDIAEIKSVGNATALTVTQMHTALVGDLTTKGFISETKEDIKELTQFKTQRINWTTWVARLVGGFMMISIIKKLWFP